MGFIIHLRLCHLRPPFVILGLGVDSCQEQAGGAVRGLRDERGPLPCNGNLHPRIQVKQINNVIPRSASV